MSENRSNIKVNPIILEEISKAGIDTYFGIHFLFDMYFLNRDSSKVPESVKRAMEIHGFVKCTSGDLEWKYPLFTENGVAIEDPKWDWIITEYVMLFKPYGKAKNKRECITRMKNLFSENPDIRKDEVIGATNMYLRSVKDPQYVRHPHYFLSKGVGNDKTQDILDWITEYRKELERHTPTNNIDYTTQIR